jgi:hypothetical protein
MDQEFAELYLAVKGGKDKAAVVTAMERYCNEYPHNKHFHPQVPQASATAAKSEKKKSKRGVVA